MKSNEVLILSTLWNSLLIIARLYFIPKFTSVNTNIVNVFKSKTVIKFRYNNDMLLHMIMKNALIIFHGSSLGLWGL